MDKGTKVVGHYGYGL